jgi:hypothetical protein
VSYRHNPGKPTAALWMLVAVADVLLVLAAAGPLVLIALVTVAAIAVAAYGMLRHLRRETAMAGRTPVAVRVPARMPAGRR